MTRNQRFIWEIYFLMITLFSIKKVLYFFDPSSSVYLYYQLLQYFDQLFVVIYCFAFFRIALSMIFLLPFLLFIYRIRLFPSMIWQSFFTFCIIFNIVGHQYEVNYLLSLYHHSPIIWGIAFSTILILVVTPCIYALFDDLIEGVLHKKMVKTDRNDLESETS